MYGTTQGTAQGTTQGIETHSGIRMKYRYIGVVGTYTGNQQHRKMQGMYGGGYCALSVKQSPTQELNPGRECRYMRMVRTHAVTHAGNTGNAGRSKECTLCV